MKCIVTIDKEHEEEVLVFAHKRTRLVDEIESLVANGANEVTGYADGEICMLNVSDVYCFTVENNKVYAVTADNKLQIKHRLYQLEEILGDGFIKINQSCIANIRFISKFSAAFSGALNVTFKNGYTDYVSRRNVKAVKERLGVK